MRNLNQFTWMLVVLASLLLLGCPLGPPSNGEGTGEGGVEDAADRFFVDGARGNDTNTGVRAAPFAAIQRGIEAAQTLGGGEVYVAGGQYDEDLTLASDVSLFGGYDPAMWIRDLENFPSEVNGSTFAVLAEMVENVRIEFFTLTSADATESGGTSIVVGINASTGIVIANNEIIAGNGLGGFTGVGGPSGPVGTAGGAGGNSGDGSAGAGGAGGAGGGVGGNGAAGQFGVFADGLSGSNGALASAVEAARGGAGGVVTSVSTGGGSVGRGGGPGPDGVDGLPGTSFGEFIGFDYQPSHGTGGFPAGGGGGGSGGGSGAVNTPLIPLISGAGGGGGGGGSGGLGGSRGLGGGASFAVLVIGESTVAVSDNTIMTGLGGGGGLAGIGGLGGAGGAGGAGGGNGLFQGGGGSGGRGGNGGDGGSGGSGGGGPSIGIVTEAGSVVTDTNNEFILGTPGIGGIDPSGLPDAGQAGEDGLNLDVFEFSAALVFLPQ